ncbi:hypothetical protein NMG60_11020751 [Bertholletia excelsa]
METHIPSCFEDRVSDLPDHIIHYILSFLESDEVVKTSLLSKRWRYLSASAPHFDLDKYSLFSKRIFPREFDSVVNRVLNFQNGSLNLLRFRVNAGRTWKRNIDEWISEAVKRNVQEVDLNVTCIRRYNFEFPCSLLTCDSLRVLRLKFWYDTLKLPLPGTGFGRLKSLHLLKASLLIDDSFRCFISSCPLLEDLSLKECLFDTDNNLEISSNSLRNLTIENLDGIYKSLGGKKIMVSCGKLASFKYVGPIARDYIFQNLSSLDTVDIQLGAKGEKVKGKEGWYLVCKMLQKIRDAGPLGRCHLLLEFKV